MTESVWNVKTAWIVIRDVVKKADVFVRKKGKNVHAMISARNRMGMVVANRKQKVRHVRIPKMIRRVVVTDGVNGLIARVKLPAHVRRILMSRTVHVLY